MSMTPIEAINELKNYRACSGTKLPEEIEMAIQALEEIQQYKALEQRMNGVSLELLAEHFIKIVGEGESEGYQRGRLLTNEHADMWDAYKAIGTVEECRAAVEKQRAKKPIDISSARDNDGYIGLIGKCSCCNNIVEEDALYCDCGQKLKWGDEE